jgi:ATP-dependent RNA helicase DDX1
VYETLRGLASGAVDPAKAVWALSDSDRDTAMAIDESGFVCQSRSKDRWAGCRSTFGVIRGKYFYEAQVCDDGLCRVGWSTGLANRDLGTDPEGFGFGGTGKKSNARNFKDYGRPYAKGDIIGCYIDCDIGTIEYSINGEMLGKAFDIPASYRGKTGFYPAVCLKNAEMKLNFGAQPFSFPAAAAAGLYSPLINAAINDTTLAGTGTVSKGRKPLAIILEPARELAEQTHEAINSFKKYMPAPMVETDLFTGGMETKGQIQSLLAGVDIITGTPGKIEALVESRQLGLENIRFFVLDEADRLLDTENYALILRLYNRIPKVEGVPLQVLMFSATLHSPEIKQLSEKICRYPTWVDLKGKDTFPTAVDHGIIVCDPLTQLEWQQNAGKVITDGVHAMDKLKMDVPASTSPETFSEAVKRLKPYLLKKVIDAYRMEQSMIFVRTKVEADFLEKFFRGLNQTEGSALDKTYSCVVLHAGRSQPERKRNLELFKTGEARFLICTDVAARGIDVKELPCTCMSVALHFKIRLSWLRLRCYQLHPP